MEILKEITYFFGLLTLTWLFVEGAAPVQFIKKLIKMHPENPTQNIYLKVLFKLLNCALCSGFWIGLFFYWFFGYNHFIIMACLTAVFSEIFTRVIKMLFNDYLNHL